MNKKDTKIGRPTESLKNTMLRVRLSDEYVVKIDEIATKENLTKSDIVRKGIDIQYNDLNR